MNTGQDSAEAARHRAEWYRRLGYESFGDGRKDSVGLRVSDEPDVVPWLKTRVEDGRHLMNHEFAE